MSFTLRILLIVVSLFSIIYVVKKIRSAKLRIDYSIYWILVSGLIIILALFPQIAIKMATLIGVASPVNLIYLVMIFILFVHNFFLTIKVSKVEDMVNNIVQDKAVDDKIRKEKNIRREDHENNDTIA